MPLYRVSTFLATEKMNKDNCPLIGFQLFFTVPEKLKPYKGTIIFFIFSVARKVETL